MAAIRPSWVVLALLIVVTVVPGPAAADDPDDPACASTVQAIFCYWDDLMDILEDFLGDCTVWNHLVGTCP